MTSSNRPTPSRPSDLTIAICTIGRDGYLQEALRSLLATTPPDVQLQLVFNAPEDSSLIDVTREMLAEWQGPTALHVLDDRVDIATSHNTALEACTTRFITFMGDDDLVLEPRVLRILGLFDTLQPTPAVIGSYCRRLSSDLDEPRLLSNKDYGPASIDSWQDAVSRQETIEIVFPSAVYQTEALRGIGGFEPRFGSAMDIASFTRLAMDAPVLADARRTFAHRIHPGSVTSSQSRRHAEYLDYTHSCMRALWAGETEPSPEDHRIRPDATGVRGALARRSVLAETMFRQGGASMAVGKRADGAARIGASLVLSPRVFFERTKAQIAREPLAEPVVTVLLKNTNEYRVAFYDLLREVFRERSIELRLVSASGLHEDAEKGDQAHIAWAEQRSFTELKIRGRTVLWQPGFDLAANSDLIITEQASKQLFNVALSFTQGALRTRHAFWGHGRNFQESIEGSSGEGMKRALTRRAHWFFAYNDLSAEAAVDAGMPSDRVTPVMNSTDTRRIRQFIDALPPGSDERIREEHGFGHGPLALFMGGVYEPKRPEFLIDSAMAVRDRIPNFELVIIGDGSKRDVIQQAADQHDWVHWLGGRYGDDRLEPASVCSVQMMPGLVGLNIVDAFALGVPTITTALDWHSPEIDYLEHGENGFMTAGDATPEAFGAAVADILSDPAQLQRLRAGARSAGKRLSIEDMVQRFVDGVERALAAPPR